MVLPEHCMSEPNGIASESLTATSSAAELHGMLSWNALEIAWSSRVA
jgi:hypothetical protein